MRLPPGGGPPPIPCDVVVGTNWTKKPTDCLLVSESLPRVVSYAVTYYMSHLLATIMGATAKGWVLCAASASFPRDS